MTMLLTPPDFRHALVNFSLPGVATHLINSISSEPFATQLKAILPALISQFHVNLTA